MPWNRTNPEKERMAFVVAHAHGIRSLMALCQEFGVSRKTGYKWVQRVVAEGPGGCQDRSRAPPHHPQGVAQVAGRPAFGLAGRPRAGSSLQNLTKINDYDNIIANERRHTSHIMKEILTTITQRGQVTIPVEVRRLLGVGPRDKVVFAIDGAQVRLLPVAFTLEKAFGSVTPKTRPEDFEALSQAAKDEHAVKVIQKMRQG